MTWGARAAEGTRGGGLRGSGRRAFRGGGRWVAVAPPAAAAAGAPGSGRTTEFAWDGERAARGIFSRFYRFGETRQKEDAERARATLRFCSCAFRVTFPLFFSFLVGLKTRRALIKAE